MTLSSPEGWAWCLQGKKKKTSTLDSIYTHVDITMQLASPPPRPLGHPLPQTEAPRKPDKKTQKHQASTACRYGRSRTHVSRWPCSSKLAWWVEGEEGPWYSMIIASLHKMFTENSKSTVVHNVSTPWWCNVFKQIDKLSRGARPWCADLYCRHEEPVYLMTSHISARSFQRLSSFPCYLSQAP